MLRATTICTLAALLALADGHGRLMQPPSRNAMWRFGYPNPVNYNDNEVFCGGFGVQYLQNDGKCGVCGDDWKQPEPREHEGGGKFGLGIVGKRYVMGQTIDVEIDLTTNHWGYFVLKICQSFDSSKPVTQECLDENPLYLKDDPSTYEYHIPKHHEKKAYITYQVMLPQGLTCQQCVIQWTYYTGNTWGVCEDGTERVGCGEQEMFRNCADIEIYSQTGAFPPTAVLPENPNVVFYTNSAGQKKPLVNRYQVCVPKGLYNKIPGMEQWCQESCLRYSATSCSKAKCECLDECVAIGEYRDLEGTDVWCQRRCLRYPSKCPQSKCKCFSGGSKVIVE